MKITFIFLIVPVYGVLSYMPSGKESIFSGLFLRNLFNRLNSGKEESNGDVSYLDLEGTQINTKTRDPERDQIFPLDYDNNVGDVSVFNPTIRDQESLRHSSLWGNKGGATSNKNQEPESEISLPAYCNPPNPCPLGYTEEQGCLEEFENTAAFSRRYQALQDCMCDNEHMFDCPNSNNPMVDNLLDLAHVDFSRLLQQSLKTDQGFPYKNLVAKKYHSKNAGGDPMVQVMKNNPFLTGEKLPVAAKKGNNMF